MTAVSLTALIVASLLLNVWCKRVARLFPSA